MNFLLVFLPILINCNRYKITHSDYQSIEELIPKPHEVGLYNEITNNSDFLCFFDVNKEYDNSKEIKIIKLNNHDSGTSNNILPAIFCEISDIKCLTLIRLKLSKLPNQFKNFKELEELYLSDNKFKEFPQVLLSLPKLRVLHLNLNKFDIIPSDIIKMNNLEILSIGYCSDLISISPNLFKLERLKELNLSLNYLLFKNNDFISYSVYSDNETSTENGSNDYTNFVSYKFLKTLIISGNGLNTFPRIFNNFINLEQLDISNNLFEEIPHEIHSFTNLEILNISFNNIENLIIKNGMINNLLKLYLEHNRITELSITANALQSLETFDLSNNNFSKLDGNTLKSVRKFRECIFTGNIFTEIERYIYEGDDLISLTLTLKNINVLSNIFWFNCLSKLIVECEEQIDREINIFEHVPINSKIKYLDLSKCFLTSIPHGISKLINLETFKAEFNRIIILENVFMGMTSLKLLDLSFNQITNIDKTIFNIYTLEKLDLLFNYIELLPSNINNTRTRNLQIDLRGNPLRSRIYGDLQNIELISIDQVNHDILRNIRYDRIRTSGIPEDTNFNLDIDKFYEELDIPINEKLDLDKIRLCRIDKPQKHAKTRKEIEEMLRNIFNQTDSYKSKEKLNFLGLLNFKVYRIFLVDLKV